MTVEERYAEVRRKSAGNDAWSLLFLYSLTPGVYVLNDPPGELRRIPEEESHVPPSYTRPDSLGATRGH